MPNELTIPAIQPASNLGSTPTSTTAPPAAAAAAPPVQAFANPSLRLDPALGLVVIEFRNETGTVTRSIPTQQQLDAYKRLGRPPPGPDEPSS